jgi:hypothetical protein
VRRIGRRCETCADDDVPEETPQPPTLSQIILGISILHFIAASGWGIVGNPYLEGRKLWIDIHDSLSLLIFGLVSFWICTLCYFWFKLGRASVTIERRKLAMDIETQRRRHE